MITIWREINHILFCKLHHRKTSTIVQPSPPLKAMGGDAGSLIYFGMFIDADSNYRWFLLLDIVLLMKLKTSNLVIFSLVLILEILLCTTQSMGSSPIIPNPYCSATDNKGTCVNCSVGYYLNLGYCYIANSNCENYNMNNGACTSCSNYAILEPPLCIIFSPTCADGSTGTCTDCSDGYVPLSGFCVQQSSFNLFCLNFTI